MIQLFRRLSYFIWTFFKKERYQKIENQLKGEGNTIKNKKEGKWRFYDEEGVVREEVDFKDGLRHGISRIFDEDGVLVEKGHYKEGRRHGQFHYFDRDGVIVYERPFIEDTEIG